MDQNPAVGDSLLDEAARSRSTSARAADAPPQTNPPQTNPPQTNPPQTNPPQTNPPQTNPPPTNPPPTTAGADDHAGTDDDIAGDDHDLTTSQLWGKQTELAIGNFPIAQPPARRARRPRPGDDQASRGERQPAPRRARRSTPTWSTPIGDAARRIEAGELDDSFPVDVYQTGSGTSTNMNVNEVIATLASQQLGRDVHPNDHVNASQSSNDVVPAAIRLALIAELDGTHPSGAGDAVRRPA